MFANRRNGGRRAVLGALALAGVLGVSAVAGSVAASAESVPAEAPSAVVAAYQPEWDLGGFRAESMANSVSGESESAVTSAAYKGSDGDSGQGFKRPRNANSV